jgi:hypothetical protein
MRIFAVACIGLFACVDLDPNHDANGDGDPTNDDCWQGGCESRPAYSFEFDKSALDPNNGVVALGGTARVVATPLPGLPMPTITVFDWEGSTNRGMVDLQVATEAARTTASMVATRAGIVTLEARSDRGVEDFTFSVAPVEVIALRLPGVYDGLATTKVLRGEPRLFLSLTPSATNGDPTRPMIDTSVTLTSTSTAIIQRAWDTFDLPSAPGEIEIDLHGRSIGDVRFAIEIVAAADGIAMEETANHNHLCFHLLRGEDRVLTRAWSFTSQTASVEIYPDSIDRYKNCAFVAGTAGDVGMIEVTAGSVSKTFSVRIE